MLNETEKVQRQRETIREHVGKWLSLPDINKGSALKTIRNSQTLIVHYKRRSGRHIEDSWEDTWKLGDPIRL